MLVWIWRWAGSACFGLSHKHHHYTHVFWQLTGHNLLHLVVVCQNPNISIQNVCARSLLPNSLLSMAVASFCPICSVWKASCYPSWPFIGIISKYGTVLLLSRLGRFVFIQGKIFAMLWKNQFDISEISCIFLWEITSGTDLPSSVCNNASIPTFVGTRRMKTIFKKQCHK